MYLNNKIKKCFLCNSQTKNIISEKLKLYYFGVKNISYGICKKCGLVMQTNSPTIKELIGYYKQNFYFENFKKPQQNKIESISRQIRLIKQESKIFPKSVLEVSVMSLYNLLQFKKNGSKILHALEPSLVLNKKIKKIYGIKIFNNIIEKFKSNIKYDLILMSHVLEHLPNPSKALNQCYQNQKLNQKIMVEVPLFERTELYPPSGLNVEHLYYFDENNLINMIKKSGYEILLVEKTYKSTHLPFIAVIGKKIKKQKQKDKNFSNYKKQYFELKKYKKTIESIYAKVNSILNKIPKKDSIYLFGSGFTASCFIYYTKIDKKFNLKGIFDNSSIKQKKYLHDIKIIKPNFNKLKKGTNIIITSINSVKQILSQINVEKKNLNLYAFDRNYSFNKVDINNIN